MGRQHAERREQDALRLDVMNRMPRPPLLHRPFPQGTLEAQHMPKAASAGAVRAAEQVQGRGQALPCRSLAFRRQVAAATLDAQQLRCAHAVECGDAERHTEHRPGLVHLRRDAAIGQHQPERVHGAAMRDG